MPLLNDADSVKVGTTQAQRVYRGTTLVWENEKASSVALGVSAGTINLGQSVTLTATCGGDQPADSTVRFRTGSPSGTIVATDSASPWVQSVTPGAVGPVTYYATLDAYPPWLPASSSGQTVTVYQPTSVSLAKSGDIIAGQSVTLTATITGASTGSVRFRAGSTSGTIVATVSASAGKASAVLAPGSTTTYYAEYVASGYVLGSFSSGVAVTVTPLVATSISLAASSTTINNGQSLTLTATVSNIPAGQTIYFRSGSTSGTVVGSATVSGTTAAVSVSPSSTVTYYATFSGAAQYQPSASAGRGVTVRQLKTKTWSADATWSQSYGGDRSQRSTSYLYYGYYSGTWGNQSSLIGFNLPGDLIGCDSITSITLKVYNVHAFLNSGGLIPIGYHDYTSKPSTWSTSRVEAHIKTMPAPKPGWSTEDLGSAWKPHFISGAARGIILGYANSNSTDYYGYAEGVSGREPNLSITYKVWE